jgi:hypothetical protein
VVMTALEEVYLASIRADLPPPDYRQRPGWALEPSSDPRSLTMSVNRINMGSPLQVLLDLPATFYVATFAAFCYGVGLVLGEPYRAAAHFERARQTYYEARHASAKAKDQWLEYKAEQVERATHLRLRAVDVEVPLRRDDALPIQPEQQP